jgi:hypothetical protein
MCWQMRANLAKAATMALRRVYHVMHVRPAVRRRDAA